MALQTIEKSEFPRFVQSLVDHLRVEGVTKSGQSVFGQSFSYAPITAPAELCLDFDCTILPPKKYFLPPKETLLRFQTGPSPEITPVMASDPFVLLGVHPYDLKAIEQMDAVFAAGTPDPYYASRRNAAILIGIDPTKASPHAFWTSMEASGVSSGFDVMLTDLGESYVVEIGTPKGSDLMKRHGNGRLATGSEVEKRLAIRSHISDMCRERSLAFPKREIPTLLQNMFHSPLWEENASKCLSCGTCNLVCPTCYCFDVQDDMELDLTHGQRFRRWDGCLLSDFARVASGENFRESRTARYRHRFYRKGQYLFFKLLHEVACVGCGRCAAQCLPNIADPVNVFNTLKDVFQGGQT